MFEIKICGITRPEDALLVAEAGADAIGLNFYAKSPRYVEPAAARSIVDALADVAMVKVGLFVNHPAETVTHICDLLELDLIQLHGDEPPGYLKHLGPRPVMRAFRVGPAGLAPVMDYLEACQALDALPRLVLLDTFTAGTYGGSGQSGDWSALAQYAFPPWPPLVLAGGLAPENVAAAIRAVRPAAVDVASGVESSPGLKSPDRVVQFVASARRAFDDAC